MSHAPFYTRYGISRTDDPEAPLALAPYPEVRRHGHLRATVVVAAVDLAGSLATRALAGNDVLFTTDLSIRLPRGGPAADLIARRRVLKRGRTSVTTAVEFFEKANASRAEAASGSAGPWAYGETTFARVARASDSNETAESLALPRVFAHNPLACPLEDEVGVEVVDARRGEVALALRPAVLNTEATLQGALVALLVERSAEVLAEAWLGAPQRITALDLRYLATAKAGPVVSHGRFIGPPANGTLHVELRDGGRANRTTATAFLQCVPAFP